MHFAPENARGREEATGPDYPPPRTARRRRTFEETRGLLRTPSAETPNVSTVAPTAVVRAPPRLRFPAGTGGVGRSIV